MKIFSLNLDMMNKCIGYISLFLLLGLIQTAVAQDLFKSFEVIGGNGRVEINWTTFYETGIKSYVVERSVDGVEFYSIATFATQGSGAKYRYVDVDIFKDTVKTFYYRVKAVKDNNTYELSSVQDITVSLSNIQQTWGSLKAMFR